MAGSSIFTGTPGAYKSCSGPKGGSFLARKRQLSAALATAVTVFASREYEVPATGIKVLEVLEFKTPFGDGSVGQVELRYNDKGYQSTIGVYGDRHLQVWMD